MATTDTPMDREYANHELREMSDDEARQTLTVEQYERREKLLELHSQAAETREEWADEDERINEITVSADAEDLGTEVDVFGNALLVHIDPDDDDVMNAVDRLDEIQDDVGDLREVGQAAGDGAESEGAEMSREDLDLVAGALCNYLDAIILRWDGTEWADLPEEYRSSVLADARDAWGVSGLVKAFIKVAQAVSEEQDEHMDVIESFRDPSRRGRR